MLSNKAVSIMLTALLLVGPYYFFVLAFSLYFS